MRSSEPADFIRATEMSDSSPLLLGVLQSFMQKLP